MSRDAQGPKERSPLSSVGREVLQNNKLASKVSALQWQGNKSTNFMLLFCYFSAPLSDLNRTNGAPPLHLEFSYYIYVRGHRPGWEWERVAKSYTESVSIDQLGSSSLHQQVLQFSSETRSASTNRHQPSAESWFVTILKDTKNRTEVAISPVF